MSDIAIAAPSDPTTEPGVVIDGYQPACSRSHMSHNVSDASRGRAVRALDRVLTQVSR